MEFSLLSDDASAQASDFFTELLESSVAELKLLVNPSEQEMSRVKLNVSSKRIPIDQANLKEIVETLQEENSFQVLFIEGTGTPYQLGKVVVIYLYRAGSADPIPRAELQFHLMHELGHQFGCLHSPEGIMSGRYCKDQGEQQGPSPSQESPPVASLLHLDAISIEVLRSSRLFLASSGLSAPFQHRQLADGRVGIRTSQGLNLIVFGRNSEYLSYEKLAPGCEEITVDPGMATVLVALTAEGNGYFIHLK